MNLTYRDVIYCSALQDCLYDGDAWSRPVIGRENGRIIDCFFAFTFCPKDETEISRHDFSIFSAPFANIAVDSVTKELIYYVDNKTNPKKFENPLNTYSRDFNFSKEERETAFPQYQKAYVLVREFAFADEINSEQKEILSRYMKASEIITQTNMKRFYKALSPEFFEWAERKLS
jgi:hypothetical protein